VKVKNLTSHEITIYGADDQILRTFPVDGPPARAATEEEESVGELTVGGVDVPLVNIPLVWVTFSAPVDLPEPASGTYLIVAPVTAQAAQRAGRRTVDLLTPAGLVWDEQGRVVGCRALAVVV
jgi:hypothetical protein